MWWRKHKGNRFLQLIGGENTWGNRSKWWRRQGLVRQQWYATDWMSWKKNQGKTIWKKPAKEKPNPREKRKKRKNQRKKRKTGQGKTAREKPDGKKEKTEAEKNGQKK